MLIKPAFRLMVELVGEAGNQQLFNLEGISGGWKSCSKKFHNNGHDCREHSSRTGISSTLSILDYSKKQGNNGIVN